MPKHIRYVFTVCLLAFNIAVIGQIDTQSIHSGLTFIAHTKNQNERTGLNLSPDKPMSFSKEGFSLEFEIKLREEGHVYGHVCRVISDDSFSFDMISYSLAPEFRFILTGKDKVIETSELKDSLNPKEEKWIKVRLNFNSENIHISVNNKERIINRSFKHFNNINICFGYNKHNLFYTTDVPPMTIKNIVIRNKKDHAIYKWDLSTHNVNEAYDEITKKRALVDNPIWEIDKHTQWNKINSIIFKSTGHNSNSLPQVAYDDTSGRIFIVGDSKILIYHIDENKIDTIIPQKGIPYARVGSSSQIIYDNNKNRLISYNPDIPDLNFFNFDKKEWSQQSRIEVNTRQHHNRFIDIEKNKLIAFGGYGNHRYNAQFAEINLDSINHWKIESLDAIIQPRYLSSLCKIDHRSILILGGYGSASGKQEESPHNYYDLHKINIDTKEDSLLWTYINKNGHFTFSNSMVVDEKANKLYALTYNNDRYYSSIYLSAFDLRTASPTMTIVSDSIKYNFLDIKSYCDLFLYKKTSSLYAVVQQEMASEESTIIDVYSLAFPPLSKDLIYYQEAKGNSHSGIILLIAFIAILIITIYFIFRQNKKKEKRSRRSAYGRPAARA